MQATAPLNSGTPPERVKLLAHDDPFFPERPAQPEPVASRPVGLHHVVQAQRREAWGLRRYAIISRNRANKYAESCGPAAASG